MKKSISIFLFLFSATLVFGQYKKAGFFGKEGRTYEIGTQMYFLGNGQGSPVGYKISFGRDRDGKQLFSSWDLQYIPSYKYSYATQDSYSNGNVHVDGATSGSLLYGINYGYYLLKNDKAERKVKPYVFASLSVVLAGGIKDETLTPNASDVKMQTYWPDFNTGVGGGFGCLVNLNEKFGIKLQGGYSYRFQWNETGGYGQEYNLFGSHFYAAAGLRLRIAKD